MKVMILAGGYGTRLSEETDMYPKPMLEIGGKPILWHIMKIYSKYGYNEFIILLGYKGYMIKEYFANYFLHQSDVTIDLVNNKIETHNTNSEPWKVTLLDTGQETMTGGRILKAKKIIGTKPFMLTYGDGVSDINITKLVKFHKSHGKIATVTSIKPEGRFGTIASDNSGEITSFHEKPIGNRNWINAGFFVLNPEIFEYLRHGENTIFEREPIERLVEDKQLYSYQHSGFWKCMDTLRDKNNLNKMWNESNAPWKTWE
ncbi:glucose-1-phosphate cytidylyltransferase [Desulfobacula sp.]|uniref:glucose-1-phosphate cytidylyltransferase n=1 Tax=Desulfobacula sp. TaxID=2593537 RepID=UPI00260671A2|nr:glucose-1-phosphate cytidylyltransferase [Desulfobacula sp.]